MATTRMVQSLMRGLDIVRHVAESDHGCSLQQLCQVTDLKAPTVHNLARTLVAAGFLVRQGSTPVYVLGPAIDDIQSIRAGRERMRQSERAVKRLHVRFPEATLTYSEPAGPEVVVRLRMSPERPGTVERPVGRYMHPYANATSLLFQAFWPAESREAYRRRYPFDEYATREWSSPGELDSFLSEVRAEGSIHHRKGPSTLLIAVPLWGQGHELCGALGMRCDGLGDEWGDDEVVEAVRGEAVLRK